MKFDSLEHFHQVEIVNWLRDRGHIVFSVPNMGKRSYSAAEYLRQEGMTAGAPDLIVVTPPPLFPNHHCAIETKKEKVRVSKAQKLFHQIMRDTRWIVVLAAGHKDGIQKLRELGY